MKYLLVVLALCIALVLQTKISIFGVSPAFTVVIAYSLGVKNGSTKGILGGSLIGIIEDSIAGGFIGPNLLGKGMTGFFSSFLSGGIFRWTPLLGMLAIAILTILDGLAVFLSKILYVAMPAPPSAIILTIVLQGLMNVLIGVFIKPGNAE